MSCLNFPIRQLKAERNSMKPSINKITLAVQNFVKSMAVYNDDLELTKIDSPLSVIFFRS